jgi:hypothetical protein
MSSNHSHQVHQAREKSRNVFAEVGNIFGHLSPAVKIGVPMEKALGAPDIPQS